MVTRVYCLLGMSEYTEAWTSSIPLVIIHGSGLGVAGLANVARLIMCVFIFSPNEQLSLSVFFGSSWKGSEGIESTRQICTVSTSEIKAENEQFDHEVSVARYWGKVPKKLSLEKTTKHWIEMRITLRHTWYLSFFLHEQNFWRIKFTPKKHVNYDKIHRKLPIFCVITANTQ